MGQCLCSWCVEARQKIRGHVPSWIGDWWLPEPQHPEPPASDLKGLAAYDQARGNYPEIPNSSRRAQEAGARALHECRELSDRKWGVPLRDGGR